jgi:hypothetical protein
MDGWMDVEGIEIEPHFSITYRKRDVADILNNSHIPIQHLYISITVDPASRLPSHPIPFRAPEGSPKVHICTLLYAI